MGRPHPGRESVRRHLLHPRDGEPVEQQLDRSLDMLAAAVTEYNETERILAAALGYAKYGGRADDPPGAPEDYATGDHTVRTLAAQAAAKLAPPTTPGTDFPAAAAAAMDFWARGIYMLDQVDMDTDEDRELHARAVAVQRRVHAMLVARFAALGVQVPGVVPGRGESDG